MTMKIVKLRTYCDAGSAQIVIDILDELRDRLWDAYGDEIVKMHQSIASQDSQCDSLKDADAKF